MDPVSAANSISDPQRLAEAVRAACIAAALEAHEQAGISGLCQEGRWEVAIEAVRSLDLANVVANAR